MYCGLNRKLLCLAAVSVKHAKTTDTVVTTVSSPRCLNSVLTASFITVKYLTEYFFFYCKIS